jgi:hypothetical protein
MKTTAGTVAGADLGVLDLFLRNYEPADAALIHGAIAAKPVNGADDLHALGYSLCELAARHTDKGLAPALCWVYEHTPCGGCRFKVVQYLADFSRLEEPMASECEHDGNLEIRQFVAEWRKGKDQRNA